jgi:imidazolonepropionase-like amidohydrolase
VNIKVIQGGTLIDGTGKPPVKDSVVVVEGSKITDVSRKGEVKVPEAERIEVIEAEGKTVMPGLIDSHLHMKGNGESKDYYMIPIRNNSMDRAMKAVPNLKKTLEMGFTTIRDGGSGYSWMDVALRNAINRGDIVGPRYLATGYHLTVTGGHGYGLPPWFGKFSPAEQVGMFCDGPDEWRKAARLNIYNGTDNIKVVASRGFTTAGLSGDAGLVSAQPSIDELRAAVEEAHKMGKKTSAHANGPQAIMNAIEAGIDSIVHGFYMNEKCAEMMVKNNVVLEATTLCIKLMKDLGPGEMLDEAVQNAMEYWKIKEKEFKMILEAGITISFSTDMGCPYLFHGENAREFACMVELGMSPMAAVVSATKNAANTIGLGDKIGTIEKGKLADIILVDGDPLKNIAILEKAENIRMVMKDGKIVITR